MTIRSTLERTEPVGLERPPGRVFLLATGAAAVIALDASSRDSGIAWVVAIIAWVAISAAWLVRLVFLAAPQSRTSPRWRLRWMLPMLILVGAAVLIGIDAPFRARFEASRPAFDRWPRR